MGHLKFIYYFDMYFIWEDTTKSRVIQYLFNWSAADESAE